MTVGTLKISDEALARRIEGKESASTEFKETFGGEAPSRIREAVCAFANDLSGSGQLGLVVIGLKDDGTPSGIAVSDEMLRALTNIRSDGNIVPPPALLAESRMYQGNEIAVVTVLPSDSPPVRYKGQIHVRTGPRRDLANSQDERILDERRQHGDRPFDISPVFGTGVADLSLRRFHDEYLPNAVSRDVLEANERSDTERLASTKMIASVDDPRATVLGLLVLGVRTRDFIPGAYIQFLRIAGREFSDPIIDERAIDGTIYDMLWRLEEKLEAHNRRQIDFVTGTHERRTETYPIAALQQLVRNAVMHRDYSSTNAPVRVTWFDDRIEIQNPGGPYGAINDANFGHATDYRNPNLAEAMKTLGLVQRFGVGIQIAQHQMLENGHPEIEFRLEPTHLLATVRPVPDLGEDSR